MKLRLLLLALLLLMPMALAENITIGNKTYKVENATGQDIELLHVGENYIVLRIKGAETRIDLNSTNKTITVNNVTINVSEIKILNNSAVPEPDEDFLKRIREWFKKIFREIRDFMRRFL